ncbi:Protein FAR1-RELATED SEQUENCE 5 [Bienertia sinuspersici]
MKFNTLQQGITFYENYARQFDFDTHLSSTKKRKSNGKVLLKYCVCSKEGFRETPRLHAECKKKRPITRMGCKARLTLKLITDQDNYVIFNFHEHHTHALNTPNSATIRNSPETLLWLTKNTSRIIVVQILELLNHTD